MKWSNLTNIFQMGWNHQLEYIFWNSYGITFTKITFFRMYCRLFPDTNILKITKIFGLTLSPISFESCFPILSGSKKLKKASRNMQTMLFKVLITCRCLRNKSSRIIWALPLRFLDWRSWNHPQIWKTPWNSVQCWCCHGFCLTPKTFILWWHLLIYGFKKSFEDMDYLDYHFLHYFDHCRWPDSHFLGVHAGILGSPCHWHCVGGSP